MKKLIITAFCLALSGLVHATEFSPTLLQLSSDPVIQYDFDGSELEIPVTVSGTSAGVILCVFTRNKSNNIAPTQNGFLGWHYVNKIDTCVYYSSLKSLSIGSNTISWDGKDQDNSTVPAGEYTYYLWAYDNQGVKQKAFDKGLARSVYWEFLEQDDQGIPLSSPVYYDLSGGVSKRWTLGNDPMDSTLISYSTVSFAEGWSQRYTPAIDPKDNSYFYVKALNGNAGQAAITKWEWIPGGSAQFQSDFGNDGYSEMMSTNSGGSDTGVCTDGNYIFTSDRDNYSTETPVDFYIYDMDGFQVSEVDLQQWWSNPDDFDAGGQANGGPNSMMLRNDKIFLNCHCSCLKQMVDPYRFLESGDSEDFFVWSNGNGDYVLDHNFEETASQKWVCMDYNVGPYSYNLDADDMLFSQSPAYDVGAVSFGLMAPDGTGLGYFAFSGETAGWKKGSVFLDNDTPFDGMYCDNEHLGGPHYDYNSELSGKGIYFLGHDAISGIISSSVDVAESTPATFSVEQNTPNPFNPTTTIGFNLSEAGNVKVDIFNVAGQKVETLVSDAMNAGHHSITWNASGCSAGVYFCTVTVNNASITRKMTLLQ